MPGSREKGVKAKEGTVSFETIFRDSVQLQYADWKRRSSEHAFGHKRTICRGNGARARGVLEYYRDAAVFFLKIIIH